jgi:exonuclease SbcC
LLESLTITNFQCHEKLELEFDPLVTTIVGGSDQGKSAILRALFWVCFNQPSGNACITQGKDFAKAELLVDGHRVVRQRGATTNFYRLDKQKPDKALGQGGVPQAVERLMNVSRENFQLQLDPAFLFSKTPGQVSAALNEIINLGEIDQAFGNLDSELRQARSNVKLVGERLEQAEQHKAQLHWVPKAEERFKTLEKLEQKLADAQHRRERLAALLDNIAEAKEQAELVVPDLTDLHTIKTQWLALKQKRLKLENLLTQIQEGERRLCSLEKAAQESLDELTKLTKSRCPLCLRPM